jgi:hypothetical protein
MTTNLGGEAAGGCCKPFCRFHGHAKPVFVTRTRGDISPPGPSRTGATPIPYYPLSTLLPPIASNAIGVKTIGGRRWLLAWVADDD